MEALNEPNPDDALARLAYRAYGESTGGLNYRGEPMPAWDQLGDTIQAAWVAAAREVEQVVTEKCGEAWRRRAITALDSSDPAVRVRAVNAERQQRGIPSLGADWARCGECNRPYAPTERNTTGFCSWACFDEEVRDGAPEAFHAFLPEGTVAVQIEPEDER